MRIGQIVFIKGQTFLKAQTGIIVQKEYEDTLQEWWYEVLCDDRCNHVLPGYLLSPAHSASKPDWSKLKKYFKNNAPLYKHIKI